VTAQSFVDTPRAVEMRERRVLEQRRRQCGRDQAIAGRGGTERAKLARPRAVVKRARRAHCSRNSGGAA